MQLRRLLVAALVAIASRSSGAIAEPPPLEGRTAIRIFTDRDGLPQNAITSLAWDRNQVLWVGTKDGPAYGNGRVLTPFPLPNRLASSQVTAILAASDGSLWFGTDGGGLARLREGAFTVHDRRAGLANDRVQTALEDVSEPGSVWAGTNGGLSRWNGSSWRTVYSAEGRKGLVRSLYQGSFGPPADLLVGTRAGLVRWVDDTFQPDPGIPEEGVNCFLESSPTSPGGPRTLLCGTDRGLYEWSADGWRRPEGAPPLASEVVFALLETPAADGSPILWVGTVSGLARRHRGRWSVEGTELRSPFRGIWSLLAGASPADPIWIGTSGNGLLRVKNGAWRVLDSSDGLPHSSTYAILESSGPDRALWIGPATGGLTRLDRSGARTFPEVDATRALVEMPGPELWAGTFSGLFRFDGEAWHREDLNAGVNQNVRCLLRSTAPDGTATLHVGTLGGLASLSGGRWSVVDRASGLADETIRSLAETEDGDGGRSLWLGTDVGVVRLKSGALTTEGSEAGLPNLQVSALKESRAGGRHRLWAGTNGGGAAYRDVAAEGKARWTVLSDSTTPALPNNTVYRIEEDRKGRLYFFTNKGVARLTFDGAGSFQVFTFTTEDGLPSAECNTGASTVDSMGRVWAGTIAGAAVLDPGSELEDVTRKPLRVESVRVAGREIPVTGGPLVLAHHQRPVSIGCALLSYHRQADTRYRTRLVGLDEEATAWTAAYEKSYEYLPAGTYTFQIWGRDYAGNESGPLELGLRVKPAPWRTPWAYAAYVLSLVALVWGGLHLRDRALRGFAERLQGLVDERTAELDGKTRLLAERSRELEEANQELARANQELKRLAAHDGLTGVLNRRSFDQALEAHWGLARRSGDPVSVLMVDIDHFKDLNDRLGHQLGDVCLRGVAQTLTRGLGRATDVVARYGGEEFVILLPGTFEKGAGLVAERLRKEVEAFGREWGDGKGLPLTVSVGVASAVPSAGAPAEWLVSLADQALYAAKSLGRNRVVVADTSR